MGYNINSKLGPFLGSTPKGGETVEGKQCTPPLPRAALSQGCWQKKARPANVLVIIRFAQEEALTSGQGFHILLMLQKIPFSLHHNLLHPSPQVYLCLMGLLYKKEG